MSPSFTEPCCRSQEQAEQRADRINQLIAICIRRGRNPNGNAFADFIHKVCWKVFGCRWRVAQEYIDVLLGLWHVDKWKSKVADNLYLTDVEKLAWLERMEATY